MRTAFSNFLAPTLLVAALTGFSAPRVWAAIPFPMTSGNYAENFDDIANWTNNFASGIGAQYWASVPVNPTGTIPDGVRTTQTTASFVTTTAEGVQKGSGNIQLLATNATDNSHAVAIDLLLDFTGVTAGTLSFDFATVFNTTGNRNGSLRVYTSTDGATFTELTAASVLNFQNNVAFSTQIQLVPLPASFTNCPTARIRFYDYNGTGPSGSSGARPKASIDNLAVTGTPIGVGGPVISSLSLIPPAPVDTLGVTVQASVVDTARTLNAVSLAWGLSSSPLPNVVSMAPVGGDFWQTSSPIPAQAGGTIVYYQITAVDDSITVQSPVLNYTVTGTGGGGSTTPVITSVYEASDSTLQVFFSVPVDSATSETAANYSVEGLSTVSASRDPVTRSQVTITVRSIPAGDRTLTVNGVGDLSASHFTSNATFAFHFVDVSIPAGYYDSVAGLHGSALLIALHNIIKGHTALSYSFTATAFEHTDKRPDGNVWDVYSDVPGGTPPYEYAFGPLGSGSSEGIAYNREHSFPQSWFGGSVLPMYSDLWIIYPTDSKVNGERGNYPYGKVGTATWTSLNGTRLGNCVSPGYTGTCFEPIDGYKGDLSRSQFYVAARYYGEDSSWPGGASTDGSQLLAWAAHQYLAWSIADAVSWKERVRNAAIYEYQHNRNPFVDHPEYASAIYDSSNATAVDPLPTPTRALLRFAAPNPFQARATIAYDLPRRARVDLRVFDVGGRLVRSLIAGEVQDAGRHSIEWDGRDDAGAPVVSGLYFGRLESAGQIDVRRLLRVR